MSTSADVTDPQAMSAALAEACHIGRAALRRKYKRGTAQGIVAIYGGHHIDSKTLVAAAYRHQHRVDLPQSGAFGGPQTVAVLERFEVPFRDLRESTRFLQSRTARQVDSIDSNPRFWWANQGSNFPTAFEQGSLWAPLKGETGQRVSHWELLGNMQEGDLVVHYAGQEIKAISRVIQEGIPFSRPVGYDGSQGDDGTLVLVEPVMADIELPLSAVRSFIPPDVGPMSKTGDPANKYISELPTDIGSGLCEFLGLYPAELHSRNGPKADTTHTFGDEPTDVLTTRKARVEQRFLRALLLSRLKNTCAICHKRLPSNLLVAGHIKPRYACTETERLDFDNAAMLVCTLGCDSLFEYGYIFVDEFGTILASVAGKETLGEAVKPYVGRTCLSFAQGTIANFAWHRRKFGV